MHKNAVIFAPGFIDVHTHADDFDPRPLAQNYERMVVTSVVAGNCGSSTLHVEETFRRIHDAGVSVNWATLVGHNTVRRAVMGSANRAPTSEELQKMKELVARAMAEGAVGLSTGIPNVIVNRTVVLRNGTHTGEKPGHALLFSRRH